MNGIQYRLSVHIGSDNNSIVSFMHLNATRHCFIVYLNATFTYQFTEDEYGLPGVASVIREQKQHQTQICNSEFGPSEETGRMVWALSSELVL